MKFTNLKKDLTVASLVLTTLGVGAVENTTSANASAKVKGLYTTKQTKVSVKKSAKGFLYSTDKLNKKSVNVKAVKGNKLYSTKHATIKQGKTYKKFTYLVNKTNHKKSGWVLSSDVYTVKAHKTYKKTTKKSHKKQSGSWLDGNWSDSGSNTVHTGEGSFNHSSNQSNSDKTFSDSQVISQVKSRFVKFVNEERAKNGKAPLVLSNGLQRIAEKRASYVNADLGEASHYTTEDGQKHSDLASIVDGKAMGVLPQGYNNLSESNAYTTLGYSDGTIEQDDIDSAVDTFGGMITADGDSNYGHRNQLIGNNGNGQKYYGLAFRMNRTDDGTKKLTLEFVSSDTNY